jgi:chaperonin GroEL (HSP60 family)
VNLSSVKILNQITQKGYPYTYDLLTKSVVNGFEKGIVDSSKSVRAILWNSLTIVSTLITAE